MNSNFFSSDANILCAFDCVGKVDVVEPKLFFNYFYSLSSAYMSPLGIGVVLLISVLTFSTSVTQFLQEIEEFVHQA